MKLADRVRIQDVRILADDWSVLKKTTLAFQRRDGSWQQQVRETYDRGDGVCALLIHRSRRTILLTRQFRFPAFVNGAQDLLIEVCAGTLDGPDPAAAMRAEIEQELGVRVDAVTPLFSSFISPGSITERQFFFVAHYDTGDRISAGGGLVDEGEDIEVLELSLPEALAMIDRGEIVDGKTIMLLLYAHWKQLV
jgi:nudix-type nucleoside diphosphatase (YffH/AdpP family)